MEEGTIGSFIFLFSIISFIPSPSLPYRTGSNSLCKCGVLRALLEDGIVLKRGLKSKSRDNLSAFDLPLQKKKKAKEKSMTPLSHMEKSALVLYK